MSLHSVVSRPPHELDVQAEKWTPVDRVAVLKLRVAAGTRRRVAPIQTSRRQPGRGGVCRYQVVAVYLIDLQLRTCSLSPVGNRLLVFFSDERVPHEV